MNQQIYENLLQKTKALFSELAEGLNKLSNSDYSRSLYILSEASIGQHTRHIIEFFECLAHQEAEGVINYDHRKRDYALETNIQVVRAKINELNDSYESFTSDKSILLETCFDKDIHKLISLQSSLYREWAYVLEHTIHHLALIKVGFLDIAPDISLGEEFGVAPATLRYRKEQV